MPAHYNTLDPTTPIRLTCDSCGAGPMEKHKIEELGRWVMDGVAEATDGCTTEPDGRCEHGHRSWLLAMGLI
jgi:hypothetical protein